jgi:hypothetical protein
MSDLAQQLMKSKALPKKDPEFYEAQRELAYKLEWAKRMVDDDRLTKAEFKEFESHLAAAYLEALPVEQFVELQKSGAYSDLEIIAGSDGSRDRHDVLRDRKALDKKITRDALDTALSEGKISAKRFNEEHRPLGTLDDDMTRRANDATADDDHEEVALDSLLGRLGSEEDWHQADDMDTFAKELIQDVSERESRPGGALASIDSDAIVAVDP